MNKIIITTTTINHLHIEQNIMTYKKNQIYYTLSMAPLPHRLNTPVYIQSFIVCRMFVGKYITKSHTYNKFGH